MLLDGDEADMMGPSKWTGQIFTRPLQRSMRTGRVVTTPAGTQACRDIVSRGGWRLPGFLAPLSDAGRIARCHKARSARSARSAIRQVSLFGDTVLQSGLEVDSISNLQQTSSPALFFSLPFTASISISRPKHVHSLAKITAFPSLMRYEDSANGVSGAQRASPPR